MGSTQSTWGLHCQCIPAYRTMSAPTPAASKKKKAKKTPKGGGSNVFDQFSQKQVAEFKEGFQFMDRDKDGIIGRGDIRATADDVGANRVVPPMRMKLSLLPSVPSLIWLATSTATPLRPLSLHSARNIPKKTFKPFWTT